MKKLAVLASGRGSNLTALIEANHRGDLNLQVSLVICNNGSAKALQIAQEFGILGIHISRANTEDVDGTILSSLLEQDISVVALAGYMRPVGPKVLAKFAGQIVNIHPGPLPQLGGQGMFGGRVHRKALELGLTHSGPTVHLVTANYDEGPILEHRPVEVLPGDTPESLSDRIVKVEHDLYWRVLQKTFGGNCAVSFSHLSG